MVIRRMLQVLGLALFARLASAAPTLPHHDLQVSLDPAAGRISVTDRLHLPAALGRSVDLRLGAAFTLHSDDAQLERLDAPRGGQFRRDMRIGHVVDDDVVRLAHKSVLRK